MSWLKRKLRNWIFEEDEVETSSNDRNDRRLHIINSDQDLGQSIAHIITYEMLRK